MKKAMLGTTLAAFALAPAMAWADCEFHNQAAMAQMASANPAPQASKVQANASHKASTPVVAKAASAKQAKAMTDKAAPTTKSGDATVVAKSN